MPVKIQIEREPVQIKELGGGLHEDPRAIRVGSQFVSNIMGGVMGPLGEPTPTFEHRQVNRAPEPTGDTYFYDYDCIPAEADSQFVLVDSFEIWDAARQGLDMEQDGEKKRLNIIKAFAAVCCTLFLFVMTGWAITVTDSEETQEETESTTQPAPTPKPTRPLLREP